MAKKTTRKPGCSGISGKLVSTKSGAGIAHADIEIWDADLAGQDIIGLAATDGAGDFSFTFGEGHMARLGLPERPHVFFKVFERGRLVFSGEGGKSRRLKPGADKIVLSIDHEPEVAADVLFELSITRPTTVLAGPTGDRLADLDVGDRVGALWAEENGFRVRMPNGQPGWIALDQLDQLQFAIRDYFDATKDIPVFPRHAYAALTAAGAPTGTGADMDCLLASLDLLEELNRHAGGSHHAAPAAMRRFDAALDLLIGQFRPPPRPDNFTLLALRHEIDGVAGQLDIPRLARNYRVPCLLDLKRFHFIGSAIFRSAQRRTPFEPAAINDRVWAGLFVLGRLVTEANVAGAVFRQVELGAEAFASALLTSRSCGQPGLFGSQTRTQANLGEGIAFTAWTPGRFPGMPPLGRFDCRIEQWGETERALRCCRETYFIMGFGGARCNAEVLEIRGAGFGASRFWPSYHEPREPGGADPAHLSGLPGPLEGVVLFPTADGGTVAATDYREWNDRLVRVVIPDGAVSGVVEMRVFCTGDIQTCGIETKLPFHDPRDADLELNSGRAEVVVRRSDGTVFGTTMLPSVSETPFDINAGGCTEVQFLISGTNLKQLTVTLRQGGVSTDLPFEAGAPGVTRPIDPPRLLSIPTVSGETQFVDLSAVDGCDSSFSRSIVLFRTPQVRVAVDPGPHNPVVTDTLPVSVELSCHPNTFPGDVTEIPVNLIVSRGSRLTLEETDFAFTDTGPIGTSIEIPSPFVRQGELQVVGRVMEPSGSPLRHENGVANFVIATPRFDAVFTGSGTLALAPPPGMTLPDELNPLSRADEVTANVVFSAFSDSERAPSSAITLLDFSADFGSAGVGLRSSPTGTYDSFSFALNISVPVDISVPFGGGPSVLPFTTGSSATSLLSGTGSPVEEDGSVRLVAATVLGGFGGTAELLNGLHALVTLDGLFAPAP